MQRDRMIPRLILAAALLAGVSYVAAWNLHLHPAVSLAWKGAGVGLLAVYAALKARDLDGWLLTAVMGFGALGDVLLGAAGLEVGAVAFLIGHGFAIWLYRRNRRSVVTRSQRWLAILLPPATVALACLLRADWAAAAGVGLYAIGLSSMAATAWISRFPRFRTGLGALMFVASDLLIFARAGHLRDSFAVSLAIWGLYLAGQTLICLGVTGALEKRRTAGA